MRTDPKNMLAFRPGSRSRAMMAMGVASGICLMGLNAPVSAAAGAELLVAAQDGATYMVVKQNDAPMRCGDQEMFYAIARLSEGTVLQTAGESGAYTMVVVPRNVGGFVPATEVDVGTNTRTVTLRVDSKLRSPSRLAGLANSWKQLYTNALPAGTELTVLETLKNNAGSVVGYRVVAPRSPSGELPIGYVATDALRPALDNEVNGGSQPTPPTNPTTEPQEPKTNEEPVTDPTPAAGGESEEPTVDEQRVNTSLLEEQVPEQPVEIQNSAPVDEAEAETPAVRVADEGRIPASRLEDLEAAFAEAREMPRVELDEALDELLAEFSRTLEEAEDDESLTRALEQRIEWVQIRMQTRDQRRRISEALAQYDAGADETAQAIEAWQQGRAYQLVGRMVTSSVYNGKNLPLLYRVQGTDPITGRPQTVGYIAPKHDQDLRHMLGRVVGVLGTQRNDASLGLKVVEPERVDLMPE